MTTIREDNWAIGNVHKRNKYQHLIEELFLSADIRINGARDFDITVTNNDFYKRVMRDGLLGIGESYMDGWWKSDAIDEITSRFIKANLHKVSRNDPRFVLSFLTAKVSGIGKRSKAFEVGKRHYDLGNDLFQVMLDKRMIYSCGYWKDAVSLDQAQENKLDLVCRKLGLKPGMRVLDIGCGWGGWARFAAEKYGVEVVGITISREQLEYAREYCLGLAIEIRLQDYRDLNERFDRVVCIGMFEHVGHNYFRTFMKVVDRTLKEDGLFLLHTIVGNEPIGPAEAPWLTKYIFPNGELPSLAQIAKSVEGLFFVEALHHFGDDYEKTLKAWYENFVNGWNKIETSYDQRFFRMWTFYLLICRGIFRSRQAHLWQFVFSKNAIPNGHSENIRSDVDLYEAR